MKAHNRGKGQRVVKEKVKGKRGGVKGRDKGRGKGIYDN